MIGKAVALLALAATTLTAAAAPAVAASTSENAPWYDTNSNGANSRANLKENVLTPSTVTKIRYLRSVTERPPAGCIGPISSPVLAGGDVYAIVGNTLSKYNAATGALIWRRSPHRTNETAYTSVAFSGNLVIVGGYFCESNTSQSGNVWAYNATTGKLVWSAVLQGGPVDSAVISGSYVLTQGADGGADFEVSAISLATGKTAWTRSSDADPSEPALEVDGRVISTDGNGDMVAYAPATGKKVWSDPAGTSGFAWAPQAGDFANSAGRHLFATNPAGAVDDVNPATGAVVYTLTGAVHVLAVDLSRVYATCRKGNSVCAWNRNTGALEWKFSDPDKVTLAAEAAGVLYLNDGIALNTATGSVISFQVWSSFNFNNLATALAIGDGRIAVVTDPRALDLYGLRGY